MNRQTGGWLLASLVATTLVVGTALTVDLPAWGFPAAAAAVVVALWLARLDGWQRLYALTIVLLLAATGSFPALADAVFYPRYAAVAALVVWTWGTHREGARTLADCPRPARLVVLAMYYLAGLGVVSTLWSYVPSVTLQQSIALGLFAVLVHLLVTHRWVHPARISGDLAVAYVVLATAGVASVAAAVIGIPEATGFNGRVQGIFSNPNELALVAAIALPLGWAVYGATRRLRYLLPMPVLVVAVLLSETRTAVVAVIVGVLWVALRAVWHPRYTAPVALGAVITGVLLTLTSAGGVAVQALSRFTSEQGSASTLGSRTLAWSDAVRLWSDRPLQGWGLQAGEALFTAVQGAPGFSFFRPSVHNSYLQLLLELGLLGAAGMLVLLAVVVGAAARRPLTGMSAGLVALAVAGLAIQVTESAAFGTGQLYPYVYWPCVIALLLGQRREDRDAGRQQRDHQGRHPEVEREASNQDQPREAEQDRSLRVHR